jgi:hypothetical protein
MLTKVLTLTYDCCGIEWTEQSMLWPPPALECPECGKALEPKAAEDAADGELQRHKRQARGCRAA